LQPGPAPPEGHGRRPPGARAPAWRPAFSLVLAAGRPGRMAWPARLARLRKAFRPATPGQGRSTTGSVWRPAGLPAG